VQKKGTYLLEQELLDVELLEVLDLHRVVTLLDHANLLG
jgi:hypothetical protein